MAGFEERQACPNRYLAAKPSSTVSAFPVQFKTSITLLHHGEKIGEIALYVGEVHLIQHEEERSRFIARF